VISEYSAARITGGALDGPRRKEEAASYGNPISPISPFAAPSLDFNSERVWPMGLNLPSLFNLYYS
jgi:hypothetical protein